MSDTNTLLGVTVLYGCQPDEVSANNQATVLPAMVVCDFGHGTVNLQVFGDCNQPFNKTSVIFDAEVSDPNTAPPAAGMWCKVAPAG